MADQISLGYVEVRHPLLALGKLEPEHLDADAKRSGRLQLPSADAVGNRQQQESRREENLHAFCDFRKRDMHPDDAIAVAPVIERCPPRIEMHVLPEG